MHEGPLGFTRRFAPGGLRARTRVQSGGHQGSHKALHEGSHERGMRACTRGREGLHQGLHQRTQVLAYSSTRNHAGARTRALPGARARVRARGHGGLHEGAPGFALRFAPAGMRASHETSIQMSYRGAPGLTRHLARGLAREKHEGSHQGLCQNSYRGAPGLAQRFAPGRLAPGGMRARTRGHQGSHQRSYRGAPGLKQGFARGLTRASMRARTRACTRGHQGLQNGGHKGSHRALHQSSHEGA